MGAAIFNYYGFYNSAPVAAHKVRAQLMGV
jgi:hypothetical protein